MRGRMRVSLKMCGLVVFAAALAVSDRLPLTAQSESRDGEWRYYFGQQGGTKYSPLAQINKDNVRNLRVVWRWRSADRDLQLSNPLWRAGRNEETPLMINGIIYTVTGLGLVAAIDPATGSTLWVYDTDGYKAGVPNNGGFLQRGLAYWTDGRAERLFVGTGDAHLVSVDAKTGKADPTFGNGGRVDLTVGVPDAVRAVNFTARRPIIAGDAVVIGNSIADHVYNRQAPPGLVHAYDVRTG